MSLGSTWKILCLRWIMAKSKKNSFFRLLEKYFVDYLPTAKGLSKATITSYKATFRLLFEFMESKKNISAENITFALLTTECVQGFLNWLEDDRANSVSTRNQRLSAIAAFSQYAINRDFTNALILQNSINSIPRKKGSGKIRTFFTRDEVKLLLAVPNCKNEIGIRDKTLLSFMYASGMRAQEVCDMVVGDIQFYPDKATIRVKGKGQKARLIAIPKQASEILKKYIDYRGISNKYDKHVFSSQTHENMSVSCIEEIYKKYIQKLKLKHQDMFRDDYSPHSMRHTTATHMLEAGVPLIVVKNFLGHSSIQTTQIYAEVTQATMNRHLKAWNDKWFIKDENQINENNKKQIPDFLR